jgi:hypothetical protein
MARISGKLNKQPTIIRSFSIAFRKALIMRFWFSPILEATIGHDSRQIHCILKLQNRLFMKNELKPRNESSPILFFKSLYIRENYLAIYL